jgi:hypothetical protein
MQPADGEFLAPGRNHILAGTQLDQFTPGRHASQSGFQFDPAGAPGSQLPHELLEIRPAVRQITDVLHQSAVSHIPILLATLRPGFEALASRAIWIIRVAMGEEQAKESRRAFSQATRRSVPH